MISCVRVRDGVRFDRIAPGGFRILGALGAAARRLGHDLTITSGTDGAHSGPEDPHPKGRAYDVRSHDLPDKDRALAAIVEALAEDPADVPAAAAGGFVTGYFFAWLEAAGTPNEHFHVQQRKGVDYPPVASNRDDVRTASLEGG